MKNDADSAADKDLELTPYEQYLVSIYSDQSEHEGNAPLGNDLWFIGLSLTCLWMFIDTHQNAWGFVGWAVLLSRMIYNDREGARCANAIASIIRKYKTRLGELQPDGTGKNPTPDSTE